MERPCKRGAIRYTHDRELSDEDALISQSIMLIRGVTEDYGNQSWTVYGESKYFDDVPQGYFCPIYEFEVHPDRYEWTLGDRVIHTLMMSEEKIKQKLSELALDELALENQTIYSEVRYP